MPYKVSLTWSGSGYGRSPNGATAKAKAQVVYSAANPADQSVRSISVTAGGSGYTTPPTISFTGGGGNGATAYAVLTSGVVTSVVVLTPGGGYTSAPTVVFSSGVAAATATIGDLENNEVEASRATQWDTTTSVPQINTAHPTDDSIFVRTLNVTKIGPTFYEVDIDYSVPDNGSPGSRHGGKGIPNPTAVPRQYRFTPVTETLPADVDYAGQAVTNSAGEPIDGLFVTENYRTMEVIETRSNYSNATAALYENTVNNADWTISDLGITIASGSAKCVRIVPLDAMTSATESIRVGYYFEIRGRGHKLKPLDVGYMAAKTTGGQVEEIKDGSGNRVSRPIKLNGTGGVLYAIGPSGNNHPAGIVWAATGAPSLASENTSDSKGKRLVFTMYETKDFSAFGF